MENAELIKKIELNTNAVNKLADNLYILADKKSHPDPSEKTLIRFEQIEGKIELFKKDYELIKDNTNDIKDMINNFIIVCKNEYVTKENLKSEIAVFKVYFTLIGTISMIALNFLIDFLKNK